MSITRTVFFLVLIQSLLACAAHAQAGPGLTINFQNLRPDNASLPLYVSFGGQGNLTGVNLTSNQPLAKGVAYPLRDLLGGTRITKFPEGRIYLSLGNPLASSSLGNGFQANFSDPSQPDYTTRWDKVEIDFDKLANGSSGGAAYLSATDFFSIPLQIKASGGGLASSNLTWRGNASDTFAALAKMAKSSLKAADRPDGAIILGTTGVPVPCGLTFCPAIRILSPASVVMPIVYPLFTDYLAYLQTGNNGQPIATTIAGSNGPQKYNLLAYIANQPATLKNGSIVGAGDLVLSGTLNNGAGDLPLILHLAAADFSSSVIYGAKSNPQLLQGNDSNGVVARIVGDYLTALNLGFIGSTVDNPAMPGTAIGASPSWTWFGNHPSGTQLSPLTTAHAFLAAQPTQIHRFNEYVAHLSGASDTVAYADSGRLQSPKAKLSDGSAITISVLPDGSTIQPLPPPALSLMHGASLNPNAVVAPGSLVLLGGHLPVSFETFPSGTGIPLPKTLGGVSVQTSNGGLVPFLAVSPDTALIQIPWELTGTLSDKFTVKGRNMADTPLQVKLAKYAPGLYMVNPQVSQQGQIADATGRLLDASHPATPGTEVVIYGTGLGPVASPPPTGTADLLPIHPTNAPVKVMVGDVSVIVKYAGLAPGWVGVYQVNVLLPLRTQTGPAVPVSLTVGGITSNTVTMAVGATQ